MRRRLEDLGALALIALFYIVLEMLFGIGCPFRFLTHSLEDFPVFTVPHSQVQLFAGAGAGFPHSLQNFPVFDAPHSQVQLFAGAAVCCGAAACCGAACGCVPAMPAVMAFNPSMEVLNCCIPMPTPMNPVIAPPALEPASRTPSVKFLTAIPRSTLASPPNIAPSFLMLMSFWDSSS